MTDIFKKFAYLGVGLIGKSVEMVVETAQTIIRETGMSEDEGKKFIDDLLAKRDEFFRQMNLDVENMVRTAFEKLDLPSRSELKEIRERLTEAEISIVGLSNEVIKIRSAEQEGPPV